MFCFSTWAGEEFEYIKCTRVISPVVATVGRGAETGGWFMVGGVVCGKEAHYTCIHRMNLIPLFPGSHDWNKT